MMSKDPKNHQDVIIVRRNFRVDGSDEGHYGGAWKIAYADFVTAMMAFFLVMWLINVTSDETKITIASYFNPIKFSQVGDNPLSDNASLDKPDVPSKTRKNKSDGPLKEQKTRESRNEQDATDQGVSEEQLMLNPYAALNEIATGKKDHNKGGGDDKTRVNSAAGDAFRDFIIPEYSIINTDKAEENLGKPQQKENHERSDTSLEDALKALSGGRSIITYDHAPDSKITAQKGYDIEEGKADGKDKNLSGGGKTASEAVKETDPKKILLAQLQDQLVSLVKQSDAKYSELPDIKLKTVGDGVELSLTDKAGFSMFDIGSSRPNKHLINFLSKISKILQQENGQIVIRGHTDGRPYKNKRYDNWQLSVARAQMVYYMLRRSGLPDDRIKSIEGYADHKLKNPKNPNAAENRRIELLIIPDSGKNEAATQSIKDTKK